MEQQMKCARPQCKEMLNNKKQVYPVGNDDKLYCSAGCIAEALGTTEKTDTPEKCAMCEDYMDDPLEYKGSWFCCYSCLGQHVGEEKDTNETECLHCGGNLYDNSQYYLYDDEKFCCDECLGEWLENDGQATDGDRVKCASCEEVITGEYIEYDGEKFCEDDCIAEWVNNDEADIEAYGTQMPKLNISKRM